MGDHDLLFRSVFSEPAHARGLLRSALPDGIARRIDWRTLRRHAPTAIDAVLRESSADVLMSAKLDGRTVLIYLLLEHQSSIDLRMPFRLLKYMTSTWERHLEDLPHGTLLPPILPVVVYHGERPWSAPMSLRGMLDCDDEVFAELAPHVPVFELVLDDLSTKRDVELHASVMTALGKLAVFCLIRARVSGDLLGELEAWAETVEAVMNAPSGVAATGRLVRYILGVGGANPEPLRIFLRRFGPKGEEAFMTGVNILREEFMEEGRAEGRAQGRAEGRAEGRASSLLLQIERKFGAVADDVRKRVRAGSDTDHDRWVERILTAQTLKELFDES